MKTFHIYAKAMLGKVEFDTTGLPAKLGLVTTIQYLGEMRKIVDYLWKKSIKAVLCGQVLGCDAGAALKHIDDVDGFLYVGTGEFHPIGVALRTGKPVWTLHPESMNVKRVEDAEIDRINKKRKGMLAKFHTSKTIGVIITTKPGQSTVQGGLEKVREIEQKHPDKRFYHFMCDTLDFSELENFPFVECWLNTMCPRVMEDTKVLNIEDIAQ
ncbi:diphthamide synthesis protein [Candidatus Woesearchaeota archaeon]|nr:diphthamide synthesis protein [Candidatus Woesearchaeota archaeon]